MRKLISVIAIAALAMTMLGGPSAAAPKQQEVEGSILMRAPFQDLASCYAGLHRRFAVVTQEQVNGVVGYHFDLEPSTFGKKFVLEVVGGQGAVDLDIIFYPEFGTLEQATDTGYAPPTVTFGDRAPGGEKGTVPKTGFKKAIVCMFDGVAADFVYKAGKGVK